MLLLAGVAAFLAPALRLRGGGSSQQYVNAAGGLQGESSPIVSESSTDPLGIQRVLPGGYAPSRLSSKNFDENPGMAGVDPLGKGPSSANGGDVSIDPDKVPGVMGARSGNPNWTAIHPWTQPANPSATRLDRAGAHSLTDTGFADRDPVRSRSSARTPSLVEAAGRTREQTGRPVRGGEPIESSDHARDRSAVQPASRSVPSATHAPSLQSVDPVAGSAGRSDVSGQLRGLFGILDRNRRRDRKKSRRATSADHATTANTVAPATDTQQPAPRVVAEVSNRFIDQTSDATTPTSADNPTAVADRPVETGASLGAQTATRTVPGGETPAAQPATEIARALGAAVDQQLRRQVRRDAPPGTDGPSTPDGPTAPQPPATTRVPASPTAAPASGPTDTASPLKGLAIPAAEPISNGENTIEFNTPLADLGDHYIVHLGPNGKPDAAAVFENGKKVVDIIFNSDGSMELYLPDLSIWHVDPDGTVTQTAPSVKQATGAALDLLNSLSDKTPILGKRLKAFLELGGAILQAIPDPSAPSAPELPGETNPVTPNVPKPYFPPDARSGPWANGQDIHPGGAVPQTRPGSCVSACGEMLSDGRVTQGEFLAVMGEWSNPIALAKALNERDNSGPWRGGYFPDGDTALAVAQSGMVALTLRAPGVKGEHMVVTEPLPNGNFLVRDPLPGVTYEVGPDWIKQYATGGVFR
ncbi:hypothetical protein AB0N05_27040 [Nocardia sp. NPDC051030]|uniref:hypothetical protein n=1 Tax=Nocardia sp. NPDC051030 TaxID=3155162 RepID=UPI003427CF2D